jgi:hypothetical protein
MPHASPLRSLRRFFILIMSPTFIDYLKICYALPPIATQHLNPMLDSRVGKLRYKKDLVEISGGGTL